LLYFLGKDIQCNYSEGCLESCRKITYLLQYLKRDEEIEQLRAEKTSLLAVLHHKDEEIDQLHQSNTDLREGLQQAILAIEYLQERVKALEERHAKDSHNSSLPPSSDRFVRPPKSVRQPSGKKAGGQKGHQGHHLLQVERPDAVLVHAVERCEACQHDLRESPAEQPERRQVIDLPTIRVWVTEHRVEEKGCPVCSHRTRAAFPQGVSAPAQYGKGIEALAVYLVEGQAVPYARTSQLLQDLFGVHLSACSIARCVKTCHQQLAEVEIQIKAALLNAAVIHQDETGLRVGKAGQWVHDCSTDRLTHYAAHPKRGRAALKAIGMMEQFSGTSVHDGYFSYASYPCQHALCMCIICAN